MTRRPFLPNFFGSAVAVILDHVAFGRYLGEFANNYVTT